MLKLEPSQRITFEDVQKHPWMQGEMPSKDSVMSEFKRRDLVVKEQMEADRQAKAVEKSKAEEARKRVMRSGNVVEEEMKIDFKPTKTLEPYEQLFAKKTEFFSTYNPDMIQDSLIQYLEKLGIKPQVNSDRYKIKFGMISKD